MTRMKTGAISAPLALAIAGLVTMLASIGPWAGCSTTPCDGNLMALSSWSGLDVGYGAVTAIAGLLLMGIGVDAHRRDGIPTFATPAILLALVVLAMVCAFVFQVFVNADGTIHLLGRPPLPGLGPTVTGLGGVIALSAGVRLRRANQRSALAGRPA